MLPVKMCHQWSRIPGLIYHISKLSMYFLIHYFLFQFFQAFFVLRECFLQICWRYCKAHSSSCQKHSGHGRCRHQHLQRNPRFPVKKTIFLFIWRDWDLYGIFQMMIFCLVFLLSLLFLLFQISGKNQFAFFGGQDWYLYGIFQIIIFCLVGVF